MREYVRLQTAMLLRRLAFQVSRTARSGKDAEAIHDLRVAIRRLSRCLRVFAEFYPGDSWKKIRKELGELMQSAGRVRDRDVVLALLAEAGAGRRGAIAARLEAERKQAARELQWEARRWKRSGFSRKWRGALEL
jgi:CHAD domain-containing protein